MARITATLRVTWPWWRMPYIWSCQVSAMTFGLDPDVEKMGRFIARHATFKVETNANPPPP